MNTDLPIDIIDHIVFTIKDSITFHTFMEDDVVVLGKELMVVTTKTTYSFGIITEEDLTTNWRERIIPSLGIRTQFSIKKNGIHIIIVKGDDLIENFSVYFLPKHHPDELPF